MNKNICLENKDSLKVAIIGAGLVGSLAALNFAKRGHEVHLFEYREDIRTAKLVQGRSINLALSQRGRKALAAVGLEETILSSAIPMRGRMLHSREGKTSVVLYDPTYNQCLYSVGRKHLNEVLLNASEAYPNISYHFEHKLVQTNFVDNTMEFESPHIDAPVKAAADLIIGADGAFSAVRQQLLKYPGFNYSQEYIEHGYLELCIPAKDGMFQMPENYLHIWPRDSFMMIALPNQDKSFTVTLSMPFKVFEKIKDPKDLIAFFEMHYKDALPLIGEQKLIEDFFKMKPQHLISVKCKPYHFKSKALIIGDAAHAMVPYYGQGMNAGMEDCTLLMSILDQPNMNIEEALKSFTELRWQDAHAICDLAMYNYVEMRDLTKRVSFFFRKYFDSMMFKWFPSFWVPLYNSVSFSNMPYSKCVENKQWQDKMLKTTLMVVIFTFFILALSIYIN